MKNIISVFVLNMVLVPTILFAFEGRIFSVSGDHVVIVGEGVAHLKTGQKFAVYSGTVKTGEIIVKQATHTQAKAAISSGSAEKDAMVKEEKIMEERFRNNDDGTVTDLKTKLVWQKCSMGQKDIQNCSDESKVYSWKNAEIKCNKLKLADKKWRLPERNELKSIIYCSDGTDSKKIADIYSGRPPYKCGWKGGNTYENNYSHPAIETKFFPNVHFAGSIYWTGDEYKDDPSIAWGVDFSDGSLVDFNKTNQYYVRCVSGF